VNQKNLGASFGVSRDSIRVRVDASPCCCESVANDRAKSQIARECECVQNRARGPRTNYESAALTAELQARSAAYLVRVAMSLV